MTRTLSLKEPRYPITSIIIKRSVIFNYISAINYYTFIVPNRLEKLYNEYAQKFIKITDELNDNNDYVDEESIKQNKGRLKRKIRY